MDWQITLLGASALIVYCCETSEQMVAIQPASAVKLIPDLTNVIENIHA